MKDIPGRYLLRLGQGELDLETHVDFSRVGRVNAMLNRRLELLAEIERLAISLGVSEDMAYMRQLRIFGCSTSCRVGKSLRQRRQMQAILTWSATGFLLRHTFRICHNLFFKGIHKRHEQALGFMRHITTCLVSLKSAVRLVLKNIGNDQITCLPSRQR